MIDALVLAAGLGTRMGCVKPLMCVRGKPLLAHVIGLLQDVGIENPIVVLGHGADAIRSAVDLSGCRTAINPAPERGLSSSLRIGFRAVREAASGAMVLHADMPEISAGTVRSVIRAARRGATIVAPRFHGQRGFPVYFARTCLGEIERTLHGDSGARAYIRSHLESLVCVDVEDPGCVLDIDRPEDHAKTEGRQPCATSA